MSRGRISIALRDPDHLDLAKLAGSRQMPSARLAGELVAEGLARVRRANATARAAAAARAAPDDLAGVDADIHEALCTPGTFAGLDDPDVEISSAALRAVSYLRDISAWLDDPRPYVDRPRPPRLRDPLGSHLRGGPIAAALDRAGGADERLIASAEAAGPPIMSDKKGLSDMTALTRPEDDDEPI